MKSSIYYVLKVVENGRTFVRRDLYERWTDIYEELDKKDLLIRNKEMVLWDLDNTDFGDSLVAYSTDRRTEYWIQEMKIK